MTGRMMVLGTNAGQADLIAHMKGRGWYVVGVSPKVGEPGQALCDAVEHIDIRDLDALARAAARHRVDLVWSISSDVAMRSVTALSERLGLPHFHDSAFIELLDDKAALRGFLADRDLGAVPYVQVRAADEAAAWDVFPCMVKPTDGQGQRGVQRIDAPAGLAGAIDAALAFSHSGRAIVEGFLDGVELSCNVVCCGGEIRMKVLSERLVHGPAAPGVPRGHLVPPRNVTAAEQAAALALATRITAAFGTRDGVLYFQMIVTPAGPAGGGDRPPARRLPHVARDCRGARRGQDRHGRRLPDRRARGDAAAGRRGRRPARHRRADVPAGGPRYGVRPA